MAAKNPMRFKATCRFCGDEVYVWAIVIESNGKVACAQPALVGQR